MKKKVCAGGFLTDNGKFLFGKRSLQKDWAAGLWDIAGGKSFRNEQPFDTLVRETFEEISVKVISAELLTSIDVKDADGNSLFEYHIYMITAYTGEPVNSSDEHTEIKWFTRRELETIPIALPEYLTMIDNWMSAGT